MTSSDKIFKTWEEIPENIKLKNEFLADKHLIDGKILNNDGELFDVYSPISIKQGLSLSRYKIGSASNNSESEALSALLSAKEAYAKGLGEWSRADIAERAKSLEMFIERLKKKREIIVNLLLWETGKSLAESIWEFDRTIDYINKTIKQAVEIELKGKSNKGEAGFFAKFWRSPLGIVLCSGPANYPLFETFSLIMPALIMGNCVVFKAPKRTPFIHSELLEDIKESFPRGVINVIFGEMEETLAPIIQTGDLDAFIYMGSHQAIENIVRLHPQPYRFRTIFGLSAKNIGVVAPSANLASAAKDCALGAFAFNGQRCAAIKLIFVHESIAADFKKYFIKELEDIKIGMPWEDGVRITPLQSPERIPYLTALIDNAIANNSELICADNNNHQSSEIMAPAILWNVNKNSDIYWEEQFAPIAPVVIYNDINTAIEYMTNSIYGQQASLFAEDIEELNNFVDMSRGLVGRININHKCQRGPDAFPFTARKNSGNAEFSIKVTLEDLSIETVLSSKDEKYL